MLLLTVWFRPVAPIDGMPKSVRTVQVMKATGVRKGTLKGATPKRTFTKLSPGRDSRRNVETPHGAIFTSVGAVFILEAVRH